APAHEERLVAVEERAEEEPVTDEPPSRPVAAPERHVRPAEPRGRDALRGRAEPGRGAVAVGRRGELDERRGARAAEDLREPLADVAHRGERDELAPVVLEPEGDRRMRDREAR